MTLELEAHGARSSDTERDFAATLVAVTPELRRIACYYVSNVDSAEDVVQSTLLTAIERGSAYDPRRPLVPWLVGILLNKIAAQRRERRGRALDDEPDLLLGPSSESIAVSNEIDRLVDEGLRQLPPKYREVLELYLRDGQQGAEIAARLRRPPGTIRAQIHRGLNRLRALLPASLALGTLFTFLAGRARASGSARRARPAPPARTGKTPWMRAPRALPITAGVLTAGVLTVAAGWFAFSVDSDSGRRTVRVAIGSADEPDEGTRTPSGGRADTLATGASRDVLGAPPTPPTDSRTTSLPLFVIDRRTRAPLPDVELAAVAETLGGERIELRARTGPEGGATLDLAPAALERLTVRASHAGHAPFWSVWNARATALDDRAVLWIPLHESRPIGGTLVDEAGRPVSGALVQAAITMLVDDELWTLAPEELVTRTDEHGAWRLEEAPAFPGQIRLRFAHPEYVSELRYDERRTPPPEELWDSTSRVVLSRGRPLELRVLDARGVPIANASVRLLERRDPPDVVTRLASDDEGRASFAAPDEDVYLVHVRAPQFAPETLFLGRDTPEHLEVRLDPSTSVALRIVDEDGLPVHDARVRRFGSAWDESFGTDAEGLSSLDLAAGEPVWVSIRRPGVFGSFVARVDSTTQVVRLPRPVRVSGRVTDASSGSAIDHASLRLLGQGGVEIGRLQHSGSGDLGFAFYPPGPAFVLETSAVGYETSRSGELSSAADLRLETRLAPIAALLFEVVDEHGAPVDYAELAVCRTASETTLSRGRLFLPSGASKIRAKGDGTLRMNRPEGSFALALVSQSGFAFVRDTELPANGRIVVAPWGRVEGRSEPGQEIRLEPLGDFAGLAFDYAARADDAGRFHFRGVPPGLVRVHPGSDPGAAIVVEVPSGSAAQVAVR